MISVYGIKIRDLPTVDRLESAICDPLLQSWWQKHGSAKNDAYLRASLGGLWLLQQGGFCGAFGYGQNGRPISADPAWDFNITHTDDLVFCAVEHTDGVAPYFPRVGLDAEALGRFSDSRRQALVERWCAPGEVAAYFALPTDEAFTRLWTKKEAYVKYRGDGLCGLRQDDVTALSAVRFFDYRIGDTLITLCTHADGEAPTDVIFRTFA